MSRVIFRCHNEPSLQLGIGKTARDNQRRDPRQQQHGMAAAEQDREPGGADEGRTAPSRRLDREHEIEPDAAAEKRRDPQGPALALGKSGVTQGGRSTTQRPLKPSSWQTSQRPPWTTADDARSLKPIRSKFRTGLSVEKTGPRKPSP